MSRKSSSIRKVTLVELSGSYYAFTSVGKAADAIKIMSSAILVERDFDAIETLYRPADTKKHSWMGVIEMQTNVSFDPSPAEEIIEPEIIPASQRPRLNGATAPEILRLH